MKKLLLTTALAAIGMTGANAQVSITTFGVNTENFDGLGTTGTTFPMGAVPGWIGWDTDATDAAITTKTSDTGTGNGGGIRNVGVAGTGLLTDRALGSLGSGSVVPAFGANFQNSTGSAWSGFTIGFRSELWRSGSTVAVETLNFQYAIVNSAISVDTSAATWIDFNSLDITELNASLTDNAAKDGNASGNFSVFTPVTITAAVTSGQFVAIRFLDSDAGGSDSIMAVDDFTFQAVAVPEPSTYALIGMGVLGLVVLRRMKKSSQA